MKLQIVMHLLEMIIEWNEAKCLVLLLQSSVVVVVVVDSEADHLVVDSVVVVVEIGVDLEEVLGEVVTVVEVVLGVVLVDLEEVGEDIEVEVDLEEAVEGEECATLVHGLVELDFNFDFFLITFSYLLPISNIF